MKISGLSGYKTPPFLCKGDPCNRCCDGQCCGAGKTCCNGVCCDPLQCKSCVNGVCKSNCDPNLCQICDGRGHCISRCDPNKCEACDGHGHCKVCGGNSCLSCVNGQCAVCGGNTCYTCVNDNCLFCGGKNPCCNSFTNCQHCVSGNCEPCLRKVSSYAELQACNKVSDPTYTPSANGCTGVPDYPLCAPEITFTPACDNHDMCYGTCNSDQDSCDNDLLSDLTSVCYPIEDPICRAACTAAALLYYAGVQDLGWIWYEDAQVAACACCDCN